MLDFFQDLVLRIADIPPLWAYLAILVVTYVENLLPPIPGDLVVVFGGYLVSQGALSFPLIVLLSTIGGLVGFMTLYALGRCAGSAIHDPKRLRWLPKAYLGKVEAWMQRWGYAVIAGNRFLSGARAVISLAVGVAAVPKGPTAGYAALSAFVWTALIAYMGYEVGERWEEISVFLSTYGQIVASVLVLFLGVQTWRSWRVNKKS